MPNLQQIEANRANARLSTGPKSHAGKSRAARNARRHGLSILVWSDLNQSSEVEALAHELAGPDANAELLYCAREAVAAHLDVDRVCRTRHSMIMRELTDPDPHPKTARAEKQYVEGLIGLDDQLSQGLNPSWRLRSLLRTPDEAEKFALTVSNLARQLAVLERYERRAQSRRRKAFRNFDRAWRNFRCSKEATAN